MRIILNEYFFTIKTFLQTRLKGKTNKFPVYVIITYNRKSTRFPIKDIVGNSVFCSENENIDLDFIMNSNFSKLCDYQKVIKSSINEIIEITHIVIKNSSCDVCKVTQRYVSKRMEIKNKIDAIIYGYTTAVKNEYIKKYHNDLSNLF